MMLQQRFDSTICYWSAGRKSLGGGRYRRRFGELQHLAGSGNGDPVTRSELATQQGLCERILDQSLYRALERTGAVYRVEPLSHQVVHHIRIKRQLHIPFSQPSLKSRQLKRGNLADMSAPQRVKYN